MARRVGSAIEPLVIGQDPKRRAEIEAQLFADFKPKDILEEIWLSDIAVMTATIEYYRKLEAAVTLKIAKRRGLEQKLRDEFPGNNKLTLNAAVGSQTLQQILGEFTPADFRQISDIADLIARTRRERERIYLLFERKRRPALLNAVKVAQTKNGESYTIQSLSD